jgi:hypothetical protein
MSIVRHALAPTVLALLLAGAGCAPFPVTTTAGTVPTASPAPSLAVGDLRGQVSMPVVAAGSANVVAAGSANVIAAGSANVVAAGSANVIAPGGGNVIAPGGGNYRLAQAAGSADELPVYGAVVVLRDPVTRQRLPWTRPVFTDEQGRFHFEQVPANMTFMIDVTFLTGNGKAFRLLTLARSGDAVADVNWRTTAVSATMAEAATSQGALYAVDPAVMAPALADLARVAAAMPEAERQARMTAAVTTTAPAPSGETTPLVEASAVAAVRDRLTQLGGQMAAAGTLLVPDVLEHSTIAGTREVATAAAAKDAGLSERLGALRAAAGATPSPNEQGLIAQAGQMLTIKPALPAPSSAPGSGTASSGSSSGNTGVSGSSGAGTSTGNGTPGTAAGGATGGTVGNVVENTTGTVGNVVENTTGTVGNVVDNVGGTVGNVIDTTLGSGGSGSGTNTGSNGTQTGGSSENEDDDNLIENVVEGVGGVVGGTLGGLTGGGSADEDEESGSDWSSGGGLLGGLLGGRR